MQLKLEINNLTKSPIKKSLFEKVIKKTFLEVGFDFLQKKNISLSMALATKEEIKKLNKKYRHIDKATDILSFAEYKNAKEIEKTEEKEVFLGELILCYDDIRQYAKKEKLNLKEELVRVVSHGTLHLVGLKHGKNMFQIQNKISKLKFL